MKVEGRVIFTHKEISPLAVILVFCFSHTHTPVSLVGDVGEGSSSSTWELISVPRVCTFPFQEDLAWSPEGHG